MTGRLVLVVATLALFGRANADDCRRKCKAGEIRDGRGCCIPPRAPSATTTATTKAKTKNSVAKPLLVLATGSNGPHLAAFSRDGTKLLTAMDFGEEHYVKIWNALTGELLLSFPGHVGKASTTSASFSPDGRRILTSSTDGTAKLWDVDSGKQLLSLDGHGQKEVWSAAYDPDGARILTSGSDGTAKLWDAGAGKLLLALDHSTPKSPNARFSPDGRLVVTMIADGTTTKSPGSWVEDTPSTARLWDVSTGQVVQSYRWLHCCFHPSFSPDGTRVLLPLDHDVAIWTVSTGALAGTLKGGPSQITDAGFSPDGKRVVTVGDHDTATLWDARSRKPIATFHSRSLGAGADDAVSGGGFSADGSRIVVQYGNFSFEHPRVAVLNLSMKPLVNLPIDSGGALVFSPDGRFLFTGNERASQLWAVP